MTIQRIAKTLGSFAKGSQHPVVVEECFKWLLRDEQEQERQRFVERQARYAADANGLFERFKSDLALHEQDEAESTRERQMRLAK